MKHDENARITLAQRGWALPVKQIEIPESLIDACRSARQLNELILEKMAEAGMDANKEFKTRSDPVARVLIVWQETLEETP